MRPIPTNPRASYNRLTARVYPKTADGEAPPSAEAESTDARGREELLVWLEVCASLGIPFPDWTPDRQAEWNDIGRLVIDGDEFLEAASPYATIPEMIRDLHGDAFIVVFEKQNQ